MRSPKRFAGSIVVEIKTFMIGLYNALPLSPPQKQTLKNIIFPYAGFLFRNSLRYKYWQILGHENNSGNKTSNLANEIIHEQPGTIAIHLHLYYIDLVEEFVRHLARMPFMFDLYISVTDSGHEKLVLKKMGGIEKIGKIKVVKVQNRGRDVAPMVVTFASELMKYEYFCHIHTKKSTHAGFEQKNWRHHLLYNLLGNSDIIRTIFTIFRKHSDIGIIYPETYHNIPYWTQTWLSNREQAKHLLEMLHIDPYLPDYLDYPAGTMFWARSEALRPLLELGLKYENFAEETKQIDGTIAHAIEHSMVIIAQSTGMHMCEVNFEHNTYSLYCGSKNLWQYWIKKKEHLKNIINKVDFVSFDIFDTLICSSFLDDKDLFIIIETRIKNELGFDLDFGVMRRKAEKNIRKKKNDYSIDDIYDVFSSMTRIDSKLSDTIKQMEIQEIIKTSVPRQEMVEIHNYARSLDKKTIIISDTCLEKMEISRLLEKNGIQDYHDILITSGLNMGKDTGAIWDYYENSFRNKNGIHVGHDEHADVQMLSDRNIPFFHVMSGRNIFYNTGLGNLFHKKCHGKIQPGDSLIAGTVISREFNSPFCLSETRGTFEIDNPKKLGYIVLGPLCLSFIIWLNENKHKNSLNNLLLLENKDCLFYRLFNTVSKDSLEYYPADDFLSDNHEKTGIVSIAKNPDTPEFHPENNKRESLDNYHFFFYSRFDNLIGSCISSQVHFFAENRQPGGLDRILSALLTSGESADGDLIMDQEAATYLSESGFSRDMTRQAYDGIHLFFQDIQERYGNLAINMPVSQAMTDFLFKILDSGFVCIKLLKDIKK